MFHLISDTHSEGRDPAGETEARFRRLAGNPASFEQGPGMGEASLPGHSGRTHHLHFCVSRL